MKTKAITLVAAIAAVGVGFSGTARANPVVIQTSDGPLLQTTSDTVVLEPSGIADIEVTAQPLRNRMPVAMAGRVLESRHGSLLLQRADGVVRADLPTRNVMVMGPSGKAERLSSQFEIGDSVMIYGRLQKSPDMIKVKAEGIYAQTSPTKATLYMLDEPKLQSTAKYNRALNVRSTLNSYKARYTPL